MNDYKNKYDAGKTVVMLAYGLTVPCDVIVIVMVQPPTEYVKLDFPSVVTKFSVNFPYRPNSKNSVPKLERSCTSIYRMQRKEVKMVPVVLKIIMTSTIDGISNK